tara:strand:- start:78 stop:260 length:183 start_codon:yes stop_codon:yes gene_type:complete
LYGGPSNTKIEKETQKNCELDEKLENSSDSYGNRDGYPGKIYFPKNLGVSYESFSSLIQA